MYSKMSMRKGLVGLFVLVSVGVMLIYWNGQDTYRTTPPSMNTMAVKVPMNTKNIYSNEEIVFYRSMPAEVTWTYKCVYNKCVREHYQKDNPERLIRVPYLTCAMTCSKNISLILPGPTIKNKVGGDALNFDLIGVHTHISTPFKEVEELLREAVQIFMQDLALIGSKTETERPANRKCKIQPCDKTPINIRLTVRQSDAVHLKLDTNEAYNLTINKIKNVVDVQIMANTFFGARHGLASLNQLIWYDDEYELYRILCPVMINDAPKFKYRGLMLDTSRQYFSLAAIKRTIHGMSQCKLNYFHWHITDTQSFPLLSKKYPQMAAYGAYSKDEVYTLDDIREIAHYARVRGVQVIPEIDAPAHAGNGWEWGPKHGLGDLALCINLEPWSAYCGEPPCGQLNPKNNNTYMVLEHLYAELLEALGPTELLHLGGDEVNLECWAHYFNDTNYNQLKTMWCDFLLEAKKRVHAAHQKVNPKNVIVWSSGLTSTPCMPRDNTIVQLWGGSTWSDNYEVLDRDYKVIFSHVDYWYLDCGLGKWRQLGDAACGPYKNWQVVYGHRPWFKMHLSEKQLTQALGGEICLWTELVDEGIVDGMIWPRAAAFAERLWTDPELPGEDALPLPVFKRMSIFRNRLLTLGINAEPVFPKYCAQNEESCI